MNKLVLATAVFFTFINATLFAWQTEYYIAPGGNDSNPGTVDKPFASLERARDAIRQSDTSGPKTVFLRQGTYYLDATFVLTNEDSGTWQSPVLYRSYPGEQAVISGGMKLSLHWQPYRNGILCARTPDGLQIDQFFVNGLRQPMARYPNYDANAKPYHGAAADAFSPERAARWKDPVGGYIHAMHAGHWGGFHYRITGKKENNEVTYEGGWQNNRPSDMHPNDRFVENIFEELDASGEWFHDLKTNTLYYLPVDGFEMKEGLFEIVRLRHLVEFNKSQEKPLKFISFSGLTFRHTARTFMDTKEPLLRSDWTIYRGGAILFNGSEDCSILDCEFDQLGGNSIFVSNYNRRVMVRGCHIQGSGASGICFVGDPESVRNPLFRYEQRQNYREIDKTPGPKTDNYPEDCVVEDCLIHTVGVVEKQAAGIQISMSKDITVRSCSIYDVGRAGINISEGTFGGHIIEYCDVFDTVRETGDHGSFNSWGRDRFWGLQDAPAEELPDLALLDVETNIIRNSRWRCDHGWDVDLDDGSSNYEIYNNVFLKGGLKLREGFHRRVWNNIGVNCTLHAHVWYPNSGDELKNNIWMAIPVTLYMPEGKWGNDNDYNLYTTQEACDHGSAHGWDSNSVVGDPGFLDPLRGDFRVKENSPALQIGFKNFPMNRFGVQKPSLKALARSPIIPDVRVSESETMVDSVSYWQGAAVQGLTGQAYSAVGVSEEDGGVYLKDVAPYTFAATGGLQTGDVVQFVNGDSVRTTTELLEVTNRAQSGPLKIGYVRKQKKATLVLKTYICVVTESTNTVFHDIQILPADKVLDFKDVTNTPDTSNDPLAVLHDGELSESYGPVFGNGITLGTYNVDLGADVLVSEISTWSFNMNENRGRQRFTLFGTSNKHASKNNRIPIVTVDTTAGPDGKFTTSKVRTNDAESLGSYRWIEWVVQPISDQEENTAFQEFQIR